MTGRSALLRMTGRRDAPQDDAKRSVLLRITGSERTPHDNEGGTPHGSMGRHLTVPIVIPNVVRNLRSGSDGLSITTTSL